MKLWLRRTTLIALTFIVLWGFIMIIQELNYFSRAALDSLDILDLSEVKPELHGLFSKKKLFKVWIPTELVDNVTSGVKTAQVECIWPHQHALNSSYFDMVLKYSDIEGLCPFPENLNYEPECIRIRLRHCSEGKECLPIQRCSPRIIRAPQKQQQAFNMSICTIFKNVSQDIEEWLKYHILLGVEHFFLYDNLSPDRNLVAVKLAPFIDKGFVTYVRWPDQSAGRQFSAISDCTNRFRDEMSGGLTAVIDIDEFFVIPGLKNSTEQIGRLPRHIWSLMSSKQNAWSLQVPWAMFGPSGHEKKESATILGDYSWRMSSVEFHPGKAPAFTYFRTYDQRTVFAQKSVFSIDLFRGLQGRQSHFYRAKEGTPFKVGGQAALFSELRLNHYHIKSYEQWFSRMTRGKDLSQVNVSRELFKEMMKQYEEVEDTYLFDMANFMKNIDIFA